MATSIGHLPRWLSLALVSLLCVGALAPVAAVQAQSDSLIVGGSATVAYTGGAGALLRNAPTYDGAVVLTVEEGDTVTLLDGPLYDAAGVAWYAVDSWGTPGYLPSAILAPLGTVSTTGATAPLPTEQTTPATGVELDPAAAAANLPDAAATLQPGTALITNTNNDGVRCRAAADYASDVIVVLSEGTVVTLADAPLGDWQPIWCDDQYGYIHTDFVTYAVNEPLIAPETLPTAQATTSETSGALAAAPTDASESEATGAITGYGTIVGTNGEGARCRSVASHDSATITVLSEGTAIALRGWNEGDWAAVVCGGTNGYVHSAFITTDGTSSASLDAPALTASETSTDSAAGADVTTGYATVMRTNGHGLRCRSGASYDASTITVLSEGSQVALRGSLQGEWQPVNCAGMGGYAHAGFLSSGAGVFLNGAVIPAAEEEVASDPADATAATANPGGPISYVAAVVGTNGEGLFCRAAADDTSDVLLVMPEGSVVGVNGAQQGEWLPVVCGNQAGFAHAAFLSVTKSNPAPADPVVNEPTQAATEPALVATTAPATAPSAETTFVATTEPTAEPTETPVDPGLVPGDHALVNGSLNLRYEATFSAGVAAVAPNGTVVSITDGPVNGFYRVDWDGLGGWMYGEYLTWTDQPASERGGSGAEETREQPAPSQEPPSSQEPAPTEAPAPAAPSNPASSSIVSYAMQYLGYPYVWAGAGPYAFDCSGFTMYVVQNTLGKSITHDLATQFAMGMPVSQSELQPGDLVFFQNTFQWGLSHVGIYIGGGQFIHAENETTGVVISDLNSSYYSSRWYGAVRYV